MSQPIPVRAALDASTVDRTDPPVGATTPEPALSPLAPKPFPGRFAKLWPVFAGVLCALACAVPAFGAALVGGASASLIGVPVWVAAAGIAVIVATLMTWRTRRRSGDACGC